MGILFEILFISLIIFTGVFHSALLGSYESGISDSVDPPSTPVIDNQNEPQKSETPADAGESIQCATTVSSTTESPESVLSSPKTPPVPYSLSLPIGLFHPPLMDNFWNLLLRTEKSKIQNTSASSLEALPSHTLVPDPPSSTITKQEEDMPAFEEWRQQKLDLVEKEKNESTVSNGMGRKRPRSIKNTNYASVVCGAKVIAHNAEAENPGAILTSSRDEYMLNSCKARKYFIVELCESVHVYGFDIGNLELFSNIPRQIQISASARFPTRDWIDLGRYDMKESRTMQNFTVSAKSGFVKYVRVEILEHYGKEHYCPISLFRVFGTSMVEEFEENSDDDDDDNGSASSHGSEVDEDAYMEKDKWSQEALTTGVFGNGITDMVVNFVKKVSSSGYSLLKGNAKNSTPAPCRNATAIISALRSNGTENVDLSTHQARIAPSSPLLRLCFSDSRGWNSKTSTCQYIWCLLQASNSTLSFCPLSRENRNPVFQSTPELFECEETIPRLPDSIGIVIPTNAHNHHETTPEAPISAVSHSLVNIIADGSLAVASKGNTGENLIVQQETVVHSAKVNMEEVKNVTDERQEKKNTTAAFINTAVHVAPPVNATPGQKESVFVRLGNRLKILELNMSLSGQYLHELSRRFKKQGEESAKNFTVTFGRLTEVSKSTADNQAELRSRLQHLEVRNKYLEQALQDTETTLWMLKLLLPAVILSILLCGLISFIVGFYLLRRFVLRAITNDINKRFVQHRQNGYSNGWVASSPVPPNGIIIPKHKGEVHVSAESGGDAVVPA